MKTKSRTPKTNSPLENVTTNPNTRKIPNTNSSEKGRTTVRDEINKRDTPKKR